MVVGLCCRQTTLSYHFCTTDAFRCRLCLAVRSSRCCPYSCRLLCRWCGPFGPCESFQFLPPASVSPWLADSETKSSLAFQSIAATMRIQRVQQCSSIAFRGIFSPATVIEPLNRKINKLQLDGAFFKCDNLSKNLTDMHAYSLSNAYYHRPV